MSSIMNKNAVNVAFLATLADGHYWSGRYYDATTAAKHCDLFQPSDYNQYSCGWYEKETFDELEIVGRQAWACRDGDAETQACSSALEDTKFVHPDNRDANDQYEEISHLQIKL